MTELSSGYRNAHIGNLLYRIHKEGAIVTDYEYTTADSIKIPSYVDGVPVIAIDEKAFAGSRFKNIELPNTIQIIESNAFRQCSNLQKIILPKNLEYIGVTAFYQCYGLSSVIIPEKTQLSYASFFACEGLKEVIIEKGVSKIPSKCFFQQNKRLKEIRIPKSVFEIHDTAINTSSTNITITCPKNSYAEKWANQFDIKTKSNSELEKFLNECSLEKTNGEK